MPQNSLMLQPAPVKPKGLIRSTPSKVSLLSRYGTFWACAPNNWFKQRVYQQWRRFRQHRCQYIPPYAYRQTLGISVLICAIGSCACSGHSILVPVSCSRESDWFGAGDIDKTWRKGGFGSQERHQVKCEPRERLIVDTIGLSIVQTSRHSRVGIDRRTVSLRCYWTCGLVDQDGWELMLVWVQHTVGWECASRCRKSSKELEKAVVHPPLWVYLLLPK